MGKITNPPFDDLVSDKNNYKRNKYQPLAVCEVKLNYLHIYVHNHYQKE
jgi:hypothetical protein